MASSPRLNLSYLAANQAQKHVTLNESLRRLDLLVQAAALSRTLTMAPGVPQEGDCWIVPEEAQGTWLGHAGELAGWQDGGWIFARPRDGWLVFVLDEAALLVWRGGAWHPASLSSEGLQEISRFGLGTEADAENPFAAKLNKALWTARYEAEGGDGDLRYTLNKQSSERTVSLLMQTDWSGRAEIGLTGSDDLSLKVSSDGSSWHEAMVTDHATGAVRFPQGMRHASSGAPLHSFLFTPGGDGSVSLWRMNVAHEANPRRATISSVSGHTITLGAPDAAQFGAWAGFMAGVAMARIWNVTKSPAESAWLVGSSGGDQLQVLAPQSISGWATGDIIQIGDPLDVTPNRVIALDISPMLQQLFGAPFRQAGIVVKASLSGGAGDGIGLSATGITGSFIPAAKSGAGDGITIVPCSELSPVSDSNLVFIRQEISATASIELVSAIAVLV